MLLQGVIRYALETDEFGYQIKRADEDTDPGMIGNRVITDLINADLVVADLTGLNPNAFYELEIRHAAEKPTIHVARSGTRLPFDNVSHRTIFVDVTDWHSIESGRKQIGDAARTIKSPDFKVSNPITQADASFRMRQSRDPNERILAEMNERIAYLESEIRRPAKQQSDTIPTTPSFPPIDTDALVRAMTSRRTSQETLRALIKDARIARDKK